MLVCQVAVATIPGAGRDVRLDLGRVLDIAEGEKPGDDFTERFEVVRTGRRGCLRQLEPERGPLGIPLRNEVERGVVVTFRSAEGVEPKRAVTGLAKGFRAGVTNGAVSTPADPNSSRAAR